MIDIEKLTALAIAYDAGDAKRIQHFIKVYAYSGLLGRREGLDEQKQNVLEAAAVLHDIGIHKAERKHGSSGGTGRRWKVRRSRLPCCSSAAQISEPSACSGSSRITIPIPPERKKISVFCLKRTSLSTPTRTV
ncbi:MAG: HD domain-containing protein [Butyricicoccus sp.]